MSKNPFHIVKHRLITEKAKVLEGLKNAESSPTLKKCDKPKYVFVVDRKANKQEISKAIENIYTHKNIKVTQVNTTTRKPKPRRVRGFAGKTSYQKKAIVTLRAGDELDDQI